MDILTHKYITLIYTDCYQEHTSCFFIFKRNLHIEPRERFLQLIEFCDVLHFFIWSNEVHVWLVNKSIHQLRLPFDWQEEKCKDYV